MRTSPFPRPFLALVFAAYKARYFLYGLLALFVCLTYVKRTYLDRREMRFLEAKGGGYVRLQDDRGVIFTVRLWGICCPFDGDRGAAQAKQSIEEHCAGKRVVFEKRQPHSMAPPAEDCGVVWIGDENLNLDLVYEGLAWWYRQEAMDDDSFAEAEKTAFKAARGPHWSTVVGRLSSGPYQTWTRYILRHPFSRREYIRYHLTRIGICIAGLVGIPAFTILLLFGIDRFSSGNSSRNVPESKHLPTREPLPAPAPPAPPPPPPVPALPDEAVRAFALQIVLDQPASMSEVKTKIEKEFDPANAARILARVEEIQRVRV